jgi:molybdate transport system ATP-binding protein
VGLSVDLLARRGAFEVDVAFEVSDGETLALLGPNGAGKSTVVDALTGTLALSEGTIEIDGRPMQDRPPERRPIGVCFQNDLLFPKLTALENVAFPLRAKKVGKAAARRRAGELLDRLVPNVDPGARPGAMSGGERQRVALARALAPFPRLLVLDEPFANVDVSARPGLRALVREVAGSFGGATVLIAHEPLDALTLADRVAVLDAGRITQAGTPEEIRATPRSAYAADLVGVNLFAGQLEPLGDGAAILRTPDGDVTVSPGTTPEPGTPATASLDPVDVSLHRSEPEGSARNVVRGRITEIALDAERARVRIDARPRLVAEVTSGSVSRLQLRVGGEIWASFKAVEVSLQLEAEHGRGTPPGTLGR